MWAIFTKLMSLIKSWIGMQRDTRSAEKARHDIELASAIDNKSFEAVQEYVDTKSKMDKLEKDLSEDDSKTSDEIRELEKKGKLTVNL